MDRICCGVGVDDLGALDVMKTVMLHRSLGLFLALFIAMHLGNHIALFWGVDQHLAVQEALRKVYRNPVIEAILLVGVAAQVFLGIRLLLRRGWPRQTWPRIQWLSGIALALFLAQHIGAALYTRMFWHSIDTNIYWAASVVSTVPSALYFAPYYAVGIGALFFHLAAYIALRKRRPRAALMICIFGAAFSVAIVSALGGAFYSIDLPPTYVAYITGSKL